MFNRAYGKHAIPAFNVFTAEQVHGIFAGASEVNIPVIIQVTPAARRYLSPGFLEGMIKAAEALYPAAKVAVHLDHGDMEHCISAITSGFYDSVMIDASHESLERNITLTKQIADQAHAAYLAFAGGLSQCDEAPEVRGVQRRARLHFDPDDPAGRIL